MSRLSDPQLKDLRNGRWETAFHGPKGSVRNLDCNARDAVNRKATIVIEHLIQVRNQRSILFTTMFHTLCRLPHSYLASLPLKGLRCEPHHATLA